MNTTAADTDATAAVKPRRQISCVFGSRGVRRVLSCGGENVRITKGQGNDETLNECRHRNLFFLLKVTCAVIARDLRCRMGEMIVRRHRIASPSTLTSPNDGSD